MTDELAEALCVTAHTLDWNERADEVRARLHALGFALVPTGGCQEFRSAVVDDVLDYVERTDRLAAIDSIALTAVVQYTVGCTLERLFAAGVPAEVT